MPTAELNHFLQRLGRGMAVEMLADHSDRELVERALTQTDSAALHAIIQRHGAMVYRVCWRVLHHAQDAEDAFQASFLVLAQKLRSVRKQDSLAAWLHGVAYRVAQKAQQQTARRRRRESRASVSEIAQTEDMSWKELKAVLDAELSALREAVRLPLVLCYLEGRTLDEAAAQLGWSKSTLRRRLEQGRDLLGQRLRRRGVAPMAALGAVLVSDCAAHPAPVVVAATVEASFRITTGASMLTASSSSIAALATGVMRAMVNTRIKNTAVALAATILLATGLGSFSHDDAHAGGKDGAIAQELPRPREIQGGPGLQEAKAAAIPNEIDQASKEDSKGLITKETRKAIDIGLAYLAREQARDGSWGAEQMKGSVAVTSLAGLALLSSPKHAERREYADAISKTVRYVLAFEQKNTPGYFHNGNTNQAPMYGQGFAILFLADAHATLADPKQKAQVYDALARGVKLLLESQNGRGGWRYQPKPVDADVSVTACEVAALMAAKQAGIGVPERTIAKAIDYLKSCQHPNDGGFQYVSAGGPSGFARTAAALTAFNRLGAKDDNLVADGLKFLRRLGEDKVSTHYFYGHYYAAKAMWYAGDEEFATWYPRIRDDLLANRVGGNHWSHDTLADPHFCTAMALIILQVPESGLRSLKR